MRGEKTQCTEVQTLFILPFGGEIFVDCQVHRQFIRGHGGKAARQTSWTAVSQQFSQSVWSLWCTLYCTMHNTLWVKPYSSSVFLRTLTDFFLTQLWRSIRTRPLKCCNPKINKNKHALINHTLTVWPLQPTEYTFFYPRQIKGAFLPNYHVHPLVQPAHLKSGSSS